VSLVDGLHLLEAVADVSKEHSSWSAMLLATAATIWFEGGSQLSTIWKGVSLSADWKAVL
jgi:hypothetical protein